MQGLLPLLLPLLPLLLLPLPLLVLLLLCLLFLLFLLLLKLMLLGLYSSEQCCRPSPCHPDWPLHVHYSQVSAPAPHQCQSPADCGPGPGLRAQGGCSEGQVAGASGNCDPHLNTTSCC